jgi:hypothetical protein
MSSMEIMGLLSVISSYDARTTGPSEVASWSEAARRARWTYAEAVEAVHQHFAFDTKNSWLMPGTVTAAVRAARQARAEREPAPVVGVIDGGWPTGDDPHWGRRNSAELEQVHEEASAFPCSYCGAQPVARCINQVTGNATKIPHVTRLVAARKAAR